MDWGNARRGLRATIRAGSGAPPGPGSRRGSPCTLPESRLTSRVSCKSPSPYGRAAFGHAALHAPLARGPAKPAYSLALRGLLARAAASKSGGLRPPEAPRPPGGSPHPLGGRTSRRRLGRREGADRAGGRWRARAGGVIDSRRRVGRRQGGRTEPRIGESGSERARPGVRRRTGGNEGFALAKAAARDDPWGGLAMTPAFARPSAPSTHPGVTSASHA